MTKKAVVYIFCDLKNKKCLVENRIDGQSFSGIKVFPGGKVEDDEISNLEATLIREIKEETGVQATKYIDLKFSFIGESGLVLYPFLITKWKGKLPEKVLDKGSVFEWVELDKFEPELKSIRKILNRVNEYVAQSY